MLLVIELRGDCPIRLPDIVIEKTVDHPGVIDIMDKPLSRATLVRMVRKYLDDAARRRERKKRES
ncbi:hypothetical protein [Desulfosediminicola flagellatus]|uniref:hypothetical protein n=1 Tax=Desulfosediminicola flagellatus TaxID=2569541 RepID=UPI0010AB7C9B|nr:hypothetical protein [Desulfosediminicola flagellatus]